MIRATDTSVWKQRHMSWLFPGAETGTSAQRRHTHTRAGRQQLAFCTMAPRSSRFVRARIQHTQAEKLLTLVPGVVSLWQRPPPGGNGRDVWCLELFSLPVKPGEQGCSLAFSPYQFRRHTQRARVAFIRAPGTTRRVAWHSQKRAARQAHSRTRTLTSGSCRDANSGCQCSDSARNLCRHDTELRAGCSTRSRGRRHSAPRSQNPTDIVLAEVRGGS